MPKKKPVKPSEGARLKEKAEDKAWKQWFNQLSTQEHKSYLTKLGLDEEDIKEWEEDVKEIKQKKKIKSKEE